MRRPGYRNRRLLLSGALGLTSLVALSSCATLGGNVRGSFSCAAPDGICAPSSTIDDRALALISGDAADGMSIPSGNVRQPTRGRADRVAAMQPARLALADPGRTQEKVLRIVFQPYIDERGRLHEASAVHAVVARGDWQQQPLLQASLPRRAIGAASTANETLADAIDRADPPMDGLAAIDPNAPDPAAVAAARAKRADPVEAIKADVNARLAPGARPTSGSQTARVVPSPPPAAAAPVLQPPSRASSGGSPQASANVSPAVPASGSAGEQAVARIKADPRYQQASRGGASGARDAAAQTGAQAVPAPSTGTVKAAPFPAAVPEDK